jgi:heptosyltransferase-2
MDEVERTLRLLSPLERVAAVHYDRVFKLYLSPAEREAARRAMEEQGVDFSRPVIVCAVATRMPVKAWEAGRMAQVLGRVIRDYDAQLIFNHAGKEEEETARSLHRMMNDHPNVFTSIHAPTLRDLAAVIANANFFFGNEGGPRHISQALDIPSFAIYPPHISKSKWLPNASERFQGIHPTDLAGNLVNDLASDLSDNLAGNLAGNLMDEASWKKLSYHEQFALVTVEAVWERLKPMLDKWAITPTGSDPTQITN